MRPSLSSHTTLSKIFNSAPTPARNTIFAFMVNFQQQTDNLPLWSKLKSGSTNKALSSILFTETKTGSCLHDHYEYKSRSNTNSSFRLRPLIRTRLFLVSARDDSRHILLVITHSSQRCCVSKEASVLASTNGSSFSVFVFRLLQANKLSWLSRTSPHVSDAGRKFRRHTFLEVQWQLCDPGSHRNKPPRPPGVSAENSFSRQYSQTRMVERSKSCYDKYNF